VSGARAIARWIAALTVIALLAIALLLSRDAVPDRSAMRDPGPVAAHRPRPSFERPAPPAPAPPAGALPDEETSEPTPILPEPPPPGRTRFRLIPCTTHDDPALTITLERTDAATRPSTDGPVDPSEGDTCPLTMERVASFRHHEEGGTSSPRWSISVPSEACGATHLVFTHLDEVRSPDRLWPFLLRSGLPTLFYTSGPSVTGDCAREVLDFMMERAATPAFTR